MENYELAINVYDRIIEVFDVYKHDLNLCRVILKSFFERGVCMTKQLAKNPGVKLSEKTKFAFETFLNICKNDKAAIRTVQQDGIIREQSIKCANELLGMLLKNGPKINPDQGRINNLNPQEKALYDKSWELFKEVRDLKYDDPRTLELIEESLKLKRKVFGEKLPANDQTVTYMEKASCHTAKEEYSEAILCYHKVFKAWLKSDYAVYSDRKIVSIAYIECAQCYLRLEYWHECSVYFKRGLQLNTNHNEAQKVALYHIGCQLVRERKYGEAISVFKENQTIGQVTH